MAVIGQLAELVSSWAFVMLNTNQEHELTGLAAHLYSNHLIDFDTAKSAIEQAKQQNIHLICYLVKSEILASETILHCCEKQFGLPVFDLKNYDFAWLHHSVINSELCCRYHVIH